MSRAGRCPGCELLPAGGTVSPGLRRWPDSPWLLSSGRPPGLRLSGPPGAPPAGLGHLCGWRARDRRVLLPEQTVHLGCSRCGVAAPRAPQPTRVPVSWLVSSHWVPLSMAHAHGESQSERQKAPPGAPQGAPGAGGGGRPPHGAGSPGSGRVGNSPGSRGARPPVGCAQVSSRRLASPGLGGPRSPTAGRALPGASAPQQRGPGLRALRLVSALGLQLGAHHGRTFAPSLRRCGLPKGYWRGFIFGNLSVFSSLLSTPCPLLGGTARPPHYGRGREEFQQHPLWHREASGRRGGLTRE